MLDEAPRQLRRTASWQMPLETCPRSCRERHSSASLPRGASLRASANGAAPAESQADTKLRCSLFYPSLHKPYRRPAKTNICVCWAQTAHSPAQAGEYGQWASPYKNRDGLLGSGASKSLKMVLFKIPPKLRAVTFHTSY